MNLSLLCKWWWKLEKGEGLWQEIVTKKFESALYYSTKMETHKSCVE